MLAFVVNSMSQIIKYLRELSQLEVQTSTSSYLLLVHLATIVYIAQKKFGFLSADNQQYLPRKQVG